MSGSIRLIKGSTQFTNSTRTEWNASTVPLGDGLFAIETDTGNVKVGDGHTLFVNLPVLFNMNEIISMAATVQIMAGTIATLQSRIDELLAIIDTLNTDVGNLGDNAVRVDQMSVARKGIGHEIYDHGVVTMDQLELTFDNSAVQQAILDTQSLELSLVGLEDNISSTLVITLSAMSNSVSVSLVNGITYTGGDGTIILPGQSYEYKFTVKGSSISLTTHRISDI